MIQHLDSLLLVCGGLGLFLLGLSMMSEGLRALAGGSINRAMIRFTRSPWSGMFTGAGATALLQSSSLTTVAAIGFVSSGLLAFPEALGLVFGANIGTTFTGWLVAILGFKLKISALAMPLALLGATFKLFGRRRLSRWGGILAGFAMIFIGIGLMQDGFGTLGPSLALQDWPADSLAGRLKLVSLGLLFTVLTQSSSAGVAAALTALYTGTVTFPQAASLIIGMDIGTTVTALIATIGGNSAVKRTGVSHLAYNCLAACIALTLLDTYMMLWDRAAPGTLSEHGEIPLVAFHTLYNTLTALLLVPLTWRFAGFMHHLIKDTDPLRGRLDPLLLHNPGAALASVQSTIRDEITMMIHYVIHSLGHGPPPRQDLIQLQTTLDQTAHYLDSIHFLESDGEHWRILIAMIHTLDHLQRLHERCEEELDRAVTARETEILQDAGANLARGCREILSLLEHEQWRDAMELAASVSKEAHRLVDPYRRTVVSMVADGTLNAAEGTARLQAIRWLHRVGKHVHRLVYHYAEAMTQQAQIL